MADEVEELQALHEACERVLAHGLPDDDKLARTLRDLCAQVEERLNELDARGLERADSRR